MADFKVITSDFVKLHISTTKDNVSFNEKRFPKDITVSDLKAQLELITGGNCNTMQVEAYDKDNQHICSLSNNEALLKSYHLDDGMRLHVIDQFNIHNELDSGDVPTYELPKEKYNKRPGSLKAYLMKNKMGQYSEENIKNKEKQLAKEKLLAENTPIGSRCKVTVTNVPCRLGTVMYAGIVETLPGFWIGVKYDEPLGKNDGSFKGKKYFECADCYGGFVKPHSVECGDFPEEDYDLNEEI